MDSVHHASRRFRTRRFGIAVVLSLLIVATGLIVYLGVFYESSGGTLLEREINRLEKAVEQSPNNPDMKVELALLYFESGSSERAVAQLETALGLNENHQGALMALGTVYMEQGQYEKAIEPFNKVVELIKDNPVHGVSTSLEAVHYYLGVAYFNTGRLDDAVESLEEALSIDWTDADAWHVLGGAYQQLGECDNAIESFAEAVRFVPEFKEAYLGLAQCYESTGQTNFALYADAMVNYISGSTAEAIRQLLAVISAVPDFAEAHLGLGLAYEKDGQIELSIFAYKNALQLKPDMWLASAKLQALGE